MGLIQLASAPGVQRDGTILAATSHTDAQWCRWQRGLPRKIGGYKVIQQYLTGIERAMLSQAQGSSSGQIRYLNCGNQTGMDCFTVDNFGVTSSVTNPTFPATTNPTTSGVNTGSICSWQFDTQFDNASNTMLLFAFANNNLLDPTRVDNFPLYSMPVYSPGANASFNGTIVGSVLTVNSGLTGTIVAGQSISGTGITAGTVITGGSGTSWTVSNTFGTVGPETMSTSAVSQVQGYGTGSDGHGGTQQALFPNGISGGIVSLAPYMIVYGNNGFFAWSSPGYPTDFRGTALGSLYVGATEITNQKILKGLPLRGGGGYSPAGLFWSVDSLVRATFIGVPNGTWQFDQLTTQSSLLSDRCVIEHDGTFFWAGCDRFLMFNGVVQEIPNSQNLNWFFDGINTANAAKSFAMKVPRYGEIWWCYPRGTNTECSHAVIYNYREKYWYDTVLPNTGRSAGLHADNLVGNLMSGILPYSSSVSGTSTTYYNMWEHEVGVDEINGSNQNAILSYYTTAPVTQLNANPPDDSTTSVQMLEPDFIQTGNLTVSVIKQNNANSAQYAGNTVTLQPTPANQLQAIVPLKDTAKILRFQVSSNVIGGNFQAGKSILEVLPDGKRRT